MRGGRPQVVRQEAPVDRERGREGLHVGVEPAGQAPGPERLRHAGVVSRDRPAAAQVLDGSDQMWMNPAAAPCWKLSPCS